MKKFHVLCEFQMCMVFFLGKSVWGHIDDTNAKPTVMKEITDTTKLAQWNVKIISWI